MGAQPLDYLPAKRSRSGKLPEGVGRLADSLYQRYARDSAAGDEGSFSREPPGGAPSVVFVLGAAASYLSGMPSWETLRKELMTAAGSCFASRERFLAELWDQLSPYIGPPPSGSRDLDAELTRRARVEQLLSVVCEIEMARREVLTVLEKSYGHSSAADGAGEPPQLGYELIAHFLRHDFIDHVINFNFDEILDRALVNELGSEGFVRIISDHDPRPDRNRRAPRYIKLHGTISAPQSLRFTREQTQTISPEMLRIIDDTVFSGGPVHLVTLGYSWSDHDFVYWVLARLDRIRRVTIVRQSAEVPPLLRDLYPDGDSRADPPSRSPPFAIEELVDVISMNEIARVLQPRGTGVYLDDLLWAIANGLESRLHRHRVPFVPAARHILLGRLFRRRRRDAEAKPWQLKPFPNPHTPRNRLRLELWLQAFKCQGMINLSVLSKNPRVHPYWQMHQETGGGAAIESSLPGTLKPNSLGQVKETFFSEAKDCAALLKDFFADGALSIGSGRIRIPVADLDAGKLSLYQMTEKGFFRGELGRIWDGVETEVVTTLDERSQWLFRRPRQLRAYRDLRRATERLLGEEWTHLLIGAESGSWLFSGDLLQRAERRPRRSGERRKLLLITAGSAGLDDWKAWPAIRSGIDQARAKLRGFDVRELSVPWWRHNRHLTLAARIGRRRSDPPLLAGGIYFRRRLKDSRIAPVRVDDLGDRGELLLIFLSYALRAVRRLTRCGGQLDRGTLLFLDTLWEVVAAVEASRGDGLLSDEQEKRWRMLLDQFAQLGIAPP